MKNSLNNVDRGMNIVIYNGKTGKVSGHTVFDLFDKGESNFALCSFFGFFLSEELLFQLFGIPGQALSI